MSLIEGVGGGEGMDGVVDCFSWVVCRSWKVALCFELAYLVLRLTALGNGNDILVL